MSRLAAGERAGDDGSARSESATQEDATAAYRLGPRAVLLSRLHLVPSLFRFADNKTGYTSATSSTA